MESRKSGGLLIDGWNTFSFNLGCRNFGSSSVETIARTESGSIVGLGKAFGQDVVVVHVVGCRRLGLAAVATNFTN